MSNVREATDANFEQLVLQNDKPVVVDFWATWCGPCIAEMPKMKELYSEYKDQGVEFVGSRPSTRGRSMS